MMSWQMVETTENVIRIKYYTGADRNKTNGSQSVNNNTHGNDFSILLKIDAHPRIILFPLT